MQADSALERVPDRIGKYRLIAKLGEGGMASVYLAVAHGPIGFSKLSVLKVARPHLADDPEILQMFLEEARLAGRLNHANVVQTYEVGEVDGKYVLVMEYLDGQSMRALHRRMSNKHAQVPLPLHLKLLIDALSGLHYAHELQDYDGTPLNLVHRDVSPHNIFVTYDGQVKVLDFGIAKVATSSLETKRGVIKGKVAYMAPEQVNTSRVDRRADIFSMGAMLWHAATGRQLWKGSNEAQVIHRVAHGQIPWPSAVCPNVPWALERICLRAMSLDPDDRYGTAAEMQHDLRTFASELSAEVTALEVAAFVSREFAAERERIRDRIEEQLKRTADALQGPVNPLATRPSLPPLHVSASNPSSLRLAMTAGDSGPSQTGPAPRASGLTRSSSPPARRVFAWMLLAGLLAPAVLAVVLWQLARTDGSNSAASVDSGSASPTTATPSPIAPASSVAGGTHVPVLVSASPKGAIVYIDGQRYDSNPATAFVERGAQHHEVRIEAPGYETRVLNVPGDKESMVAVDLKPVAASTTAGGSARPTGVKASAKRSSGTGNEAEQQPHPDATPTRKTGTDNVDPWAPTN
jgi:serine/threonine-protein kinase